MFHGRIPWVGSAWTWCIYLSLKYKIKLSISQWFSVPCASDRAQKNHFFHLKQQNKSAALTVNYRQPSNNCKRVPESSNLLMLIKQKDVPSLIVEISFSGIFGHTFKLISLFLHNMVLHGVLDARFHIRLLLLLIKY